MSVLDTLIRAAVRQPAWIAIAALCVIAIAFVIFSAIRWGIPNIKLTLGIVIVLIVVVVILLSGGGVINIFGQPIVESNIPATQPDETKRATIEVLPRGEKSKVDVPIKGRHVNPLQRTLGDLGLDVRFIRPETRTWMGRVNAIKDPLEVWWFTGTEPSSVDISAATGAVTITMRTEVTPTTKALTTAIKILPVLRGMQAELLRNQEADIAIPAADLYIKARGVEDLVRINGIDTAAIYGYNEVVTGTRTLLLQAARYTAAVHVDVALSEPEAYRYDVRVLQGNTIALQAQMGLYQSQFSGLNPTDTKQKAALKKTLIEFVRDQYAPVWAMAENLRQIGEDPNMIDPSTGGSLYNDNSFGLVEDLIALLEQIKVDVDGVIGAL